MARPKRFELLPQIYREQRLLSLSVDQAAARSRINSVARSALPERHVRPGG